MIDVIRSYDDRRRGSILAWLLVCFLLVIGVLVMGGVFFASRVRIHENAAANDVQVDTPFGSVHVQNDGKGHLALPSIPVYPGAKTLQSRDNTIVDISAFFGKQQDIHVVAGKWSTSDSIDRVRKYYEDKFPDMSVIQHQGKVELHGGDGLAKRVIVLRRTGSGTEISLASVGEAKAN